MHARCASISAGDDERSALDVFLSESGVLG